MSDIKGFPLFVFGVTVGLVRAVLTDIDVFLLVVLGILIGFAISPLWGAIAFFSLYIFSRTFLHAQTILASKVELVGRVINRHAERLVSHTGHDGDAETLPSDPQ